MDIILLFSYFFRFVSFIDDMGVILWFVEIDFNGDYFLCLFLYMYMLYY